MISQTGDKFVQAMRKTSFTTKPPEADPKEIPFIVPRSRPGLLRKDSSISTTGTSLSTPDCSPCATRKLTIPGAQNLGTLNPELYSCPEEGDISDYPDGHIGRIWFALEYTNEKLSVSVLKIRNLPSRPGAGENVCDPFVRVYLLPDERHHMQSKSRRKSCNPNIDESFQFDVARDHFDERSVKFIVMDVDSLKRNVPIGKVIFPLKEYSKVKQRRFLAWRDLVKDDCEATCQLGELHCSLSFNANLERLTVEIIEAKDLRPADADDPEELDCFVKVALLFGGKSEKSKKTRIVRKCFSPVFNESFVFKLARQKLELSSLSFHIMEAKPERQIGRVVLGGQMFTKGKPLQHWENMIKNEKEVIHDWHYLGE